MLAAANPAGTSRLRLDAEAAAIDEALRASGHRDALHLNTAWAVDFTRLLDAGLRHAPHVLHFSGHGDGGGYGRSLAAAFRLARATLVRPR